MDSTRASGRKGRDFIARHGETVYNIAGRMQGDHTHTPLTRAGFRQADEMGAALRDLLGAKPKLTLWVSSAGRALQTLAVICEHLELDWHNANRDDRLVEIGMGDWSGKYYAELGDATADFLDPVHRLYRHPPPGGEWYPSIAVRVSSWLADTDDDPGDRLVIMHGMSSRILRGVMTGIPAMAEFGAPAAPDLPQGSIALIEGGVESVAHLGSGKVANAAV